MGRSCPLKTQTWIQAILTNDQMLGANILWFSKIFRFYIDLKIHRTRESKWYSMALLYIHISIFFYIENIDMKKYIKTKFVQCFYALIHQYLQNSCIFIRSFSGMGNIFIISYIFITLLIKKSENDFYKNYYSHLFNGSLGSLLA